MNEDGRFYDFSYLPRAVVEQTGQFAGSVLSRGAGALIGGTLGAAGGSVIPGVGSVAGGTAGATTGALLGPALFEGMQILGPVALERAENNGRTKPSSEDWSVAFATAAGSGALNSIAPGAQGILRRALLEGGTEAVQAVIQQSGETALTDVGLDVNLREAVGEGILGAGSAGIVDTTTTAVDKAVSSEAGQAFLDAEEGAIKIPRFRTDGRTGEVRVISAIPEVVEQIEWPKNGLKGSQLLKELAESPSVKNSEVASLGMEIDPGVRYTRQEIDDIIKPRLWSTEVKYGQDYEYAQRQPINDSHVDYQEVKLNLDRKGYPIFAPADRPRHWTANNLAHARYSVNADKRGNYLLAEEIQSDLIQYGFKGEKKAPTFAEQFALLEDDYSFVDALSHDILKSIPQEAWRELAAGDGTVTKETLRNLKASFDLPPQTTRANIRDVLADIKEFVSERSGIARPPITKVEDIANLMVRQLFAEADSRNIDRVVLPPFESIVAQRFEVYSPEYLNALKPNSAFYKTYVKGVNKALEEFKSELGDNLQITQRNLNYRDPMEDFGPMAYNAVGDPPASVKSWEEYFDKFFVHDFVSWYAWVKKDGTYVLPRDTSDIVLDPNDFPVLQGYTRKNRVDPPSGLTAEEFRKLFSNMPIEGGTAAVFAHQQNAGYLEALRGPHLMPATEIDISGARQNGYDFGTIYMAEGGLVDRTQQAFGMAEGGAVMTSLRPQPRPVGSEEIVKPKPNPRAEQFALDRQRQSAYNMANDEYRQDLQPYTENNPFAQLGLDPNKHRHISHENKDGSLAAWHFGEAMPKPAVDSYLGHYGVQNTQGAKGGEIVTARNSARPGVLAHEYSHRGFGMVEDEFARDPEGFRNRYGAETADFVDMIWSVLAVQRLEPQVVGQMLSPERVQAVLGFLKANPELSNPEEWVVELFDHSHEEGMAEGRQYASPLDQLAFQLGQAGGAKPEEWKMKAADGLVRAANDLLQKGAMQ